MNTIPSDWISTGLGSEDEARAIYAYCGGKKWDDDFDVYDCPDGWEFVGDGSSRAVYRAPSGVCYKVEFYHEHDHSYNHQEQKNFEYLRRPGKLLEGWSVPRSSLYSFYANARAYDPATHKPEVVYALIHVLAIEFVKGRSIGYSDPERSHMINSVESMGLFDCARGNVLRTDTGWAIVDAGETYLDPADEPRKVPAYN